MAVTRAAGAAAVAVRPELGRAHEAPARTRRTKISDHAPVRTAPGRAWFGRSARVGVLGTAVLIMALCDLVLTLDFLFAGAMWEHNPVARSVMSLRSPGALAALKGLSLLPGAVLLVRYRTHPMAEATAWCAFAVMAMVMLRWWMFSGITDELITIAGDPSLIGSRHYVAWRP